MYSFVVYLGQGREIPIVHRVIKVNSIYWPFHQILIPFETCVIISFKNELSVPLHDTLSRMVHFDSWRLIVVSFHHYYLLQVKQNMLIVSFDVSLNGNATKVGLLVCSKNLIRANQINRSFSFLQVHERQDSGEVDVLTKGAICRTI